MDRLPEGVLGSRTPRGPHALAPPATRLARAGARAGGGPSAHPRGPNVYPNSEANVKQPHTAITGSSSLIKVKIVKLVNDINKRYPQKMTLTLPFLRKSSRAKTGLRGATCANVQQWDCVSAEGHSSCHGRRQLWAGAARYHRGERVNTPDLAAAGCTVFPRVTIRRAATYACGL